MNRLLPGLCALALLPLPALAETWTVAEVAPVLQTPVLTEADADADADDPAVWVNRADAARSLIVTAVKNGGVRVYDLAGATVQEILMPEGGRINNVDVVYGVAMGDGSTADLVIGSDRGLDIIRIWRIDGSAAAPLTEITAPDAGRAFPNRYVTGSDATEENPLDDQMTVYGLTLWKDGDSVWIAGTQRTNPVVGIFRLETRADGTAIAVLDHDVRVPAVHKGQDLTIENDDDPLKDWSTQFEGLAVDYTTGTLYAGQEDVGIWAVPVAGGEPKLVYEGRGAAGSSFFNPDSVVTRDVEGLAIYYAADGTRYLLASSQGNAHGDSPAPDAPYDNSFVVFDITQPAEALVPLGAFRIVATGDIDAVQESDGADVIAMALPGFPNGLFITQDGYAGDLDNLDGEVSATNFKFVDWKAIADAFTPPLKVTPDARDPRF
jgi:myo-inositol-hexaphosphate 3-phosphohydrolase